MTHLTARQRFLTRGLLALRRWGRGMTLGVRVLLIDNAGVVLVRHTYVPGWYLPGGAVAGGETAHDAAQREVQEETGIELYPPMQLFGIYRNIGMHPRDHVALFVARSFGPSDTPFRPSREIAEVRTFRPHALPEGTTESTRRRIEEVLMATDPAPDW